MMVLLREQPSKCCKAVLISDSPAFSGVSDFDRQYYLIYNSRNICIFLRQVIYIIDEFLINLLKMEAIVSLNVNIYLL